MCGIATRQKHSHSKPINLEQELLLGTPNNIYNLTKDQYNMVELSVTNSEIVESCIKRDADYKPFSQTLFNYFKRNRVNNEFNQKDYLEKVKQINLDNGTRASDECCKFISNYIVGNYNFNKRLHGGDIKLVDDLLEYLVKNGQRKEKSLCSKVCRYLEEWMRPDENLSNFTINDSVVRGVLPYYLAFYSIKKSTELKALDIDSLSYVDFIVLFDQVKNKIPALNRHQLDHLLWYSYKDDNISFALAYHLSLSINYKLIAFYRINCLISLNQVKFISEIMKNKYDTLLLTSSNCFILYLPSSE